VHVEWTPNPNQQFDIRRFNFRMRRASQPRAAPARSVTGRRRGIPGFVDVRAPDRRAP
jgi:hypothetical protein